MGISQGIMGPVQREDGIFVFNSPIGDGHIPMIALADLGFFARYAFDHHAQTSGKTWRLRATGLAGSTLVATFTKVTGQKSQYNREALDVWLAHTESAEKPVVAEGGLGPTSWTEIFTGWWNAFRDDANKRDMDWIRKINPNVVHP
jgi:uncharacterized protein YbjT (DUF2867 family)